MKSATSLLLFLLCIPSLGFSQATQALMGTWVVDFDATMEMAKQSPKYNSAEAIRVESMIRKMVKVFTMTIDTDQVKMSRGGRSQEFPYVLVESEGAQPIVLVCDAGSEKVHLSFTILEDGMINFKSDANDDMDFYVWKPKGEETEVASEDAVLAALVAQAINENLNPSVEKQIKKNLRTFQSAADMYMLEYGVAEVSYDQVVGEYFKPLKPVNGEDYTQLKTTARDRTVSIADKDGVSYSTGER